MVYDWTNKEEPCRRMYLEERKHLEEIMQHFTDTEGFSPSKRAYQVQFKRWGIIKQSPAHKNDALVARVKELWEKNASQKDMLRILESEGFHIKERELMRVRSRNRWLLRTPNPVKPPGPLVNLSLETDHNAIHNLAQWAANAVDSTGEIQDHDLAVALSAPLVPDELIAKRKERIDSLHANDAEKWASRKRRRRTRGWAGMPPDPPDCAARYPSETTLDESKKLLQLDTELYKEARERFQDICREDGITKKTAVGPEKWQSAKDQLVQSVPALHALFWDGTDNAKKQLALDVLCTDVTKRMRNTQSRLTLSEAKNLLGLNPHQSRLAREQFYEGLKAGGFTTKLEFGEESWKLLKERWVQQSPVLTEAMGTGPADPQYEDKLKALEVICRDVMKRLGDDIRKASRGETRSRPSADPVNINLSTKRARQPQWQNNPPVLPSQPVMDDSDLQIDPSLLRAVMPTFS